MNRRDVLSTLQFIVEADSTKPFDPSRRKKESCGRKSLIEDLDVSAQIIYKALIKGMSVTMATYTVNLHRVNYNQEKISRSTVKDFMSRSCMIEKTARDTKKSGSSDINTAWAQGRLVFAEQLEEMFRLRRLDPNHPDVINSEFLPIYINGYISWDEKHLKQKVGTHTKQEYRVYTNIDGEFATPQFQGTLPPKKKKVSLKFEQEARGLFGCAVTHDTDDDETLVGKPLPIFNYTNRLVIGAIRFEKEVDDEMKNKLALGDIPTPTVLVSIWKGGYERRYGIDARIQAMLIVNKTYCNVTELIDHIWYTSLAFYKGTKYKLNFRIFHDHLSALWEKAAIEYMKKLGMWDKLIKITGSNNARVVKLYQDSLPGNSLENARGTDSHGFSDLMTIIYANVALTCDYDDNDERKFLLSTPNHCCKAMERAWSIVPSKRFVDDMMDWPRVNLKIIESRGGMVEGEYLRSGKRELKTDGVTQKICKAGTRDRKETLTCTPIHPDSLAGLAGILKFGKDKHDEFERRRLVAEFSVAQDEDEDDDIVT